MERQTDGDGAAKEEKEIKHDGKIKQRVREEKVKTLGNVNSSSVLSRSVLLLTP